MPEVPKDKNKPPAPTTTHQEPIINPRVSSIQNRASRIKHLAYFAQIPTSLRTLVSSWQQFALYNCKARSTNRPIMRKTNPIRKAPKPTQPLLQQRITEQNHPYPTRKNKPNQTQFITAKPLAKTDQTQFVTAKLQAKPDSPAPGKNPKSWNEVEIPIYRGGFFFFVSWSLGGYRQSDIRNKSFARHLRRH